MNDFEKQIRLEQIELLENLYHDKEETLKVCLKLKQPDKKIMNRIKSMREIIDKIEMLKKELDID